MLVLQEAPLQRWGLAEGADPHPPLTGRHRTPHYLHDDVKGKVEQQVADADGQQVGGKVVGPHKETICSAGGGEGRWSVRPQEGVLQGHGRGCSGSAVMTLPTSAAAWPESASSRTPATHTHSDQLMRFPITSSTIRS